MAPAHVRIDGGDSGTHAKVGGVGRMPPASRRRWSLLHVAKRLYPILVLLVVWQFVSQRSVSYATLFPSPIRTLSTMISMIGSGTLFQDIGASLSRLGLGYLIALAGGFILAATMARYQIAEDFWSPIIDLIGPIPGLAWAPFAILWFGLGNTATIFIVALAGIFPVIANSLAGLKSVSRVLVAAARSMGTGEVQLFYRILIPAAVPHILTGARLGRQRGWRALVAGEMIAATSHGLGFRIFDSREFMQTGVMMASLFTIGLFGYLTEAVIFRVVERQTIVRWGMIGSGLRGRR